MIGKTESIWIILGVHSLVLVHRLVELENGNPPWGGQRGDVPPETNSASPTSQLRTLLSTDPNPVKTHAASYTTKLVGTAKKKRIFKHQITSTPKPPNYLLLQPKVQQSSTLTLIRPHSTAITASAFGPLGLGIHFSISSF